MKESAFQPENQPGHGMLWGLVFGMRGTISRCLWAAELEHPILPPITPLTLSGHDAAGVGIMIIYGGVCTFQVVCGRTVHAEPLAENIARQLCWGDRWPLFSLAETHRIKTCDSGTLSWKPSLLLTICDSQAKLFNIPSMALPHYICKMVGILVPTS